MFNKFTEYLKQNKLFILLLIILILILCYLYIFPKFFYVSEGLDQNMCPQSQFTSFNTNEFLGKYVHLKYEKHVIDSKTGIKTKIPYYLALMKKVDCINSFKGPGDDCDYNIAILQRVKNNFSTFVLDKKNSGNSDKYVITSIVDSVKPPKPPLSQNLNYLNTNPFLCFDGGVPDTIYFELETTNIGYHLKFEIAVENSVQYFYLSECTDMPVRSCESGSYNFTRLCVVPNRDAAIHFTFELAAYQPISIPLLQNLKTTTSENSKESFKSDLESLITLNSTNSTLMSLPGADNISYHFETFGKV
jgi:hypothetical protein